MAQKCEKAHNSYKNHVIFWLVEKKIFKYNKIVYKESSAKTSKTIVITVKYENFCQFVLEKKKVLMKYYKTLKALSHDEGKVGRDLQNFLWKTPAVKSNLYHEGEGYCDPLLICQYWEFF